jgi:ABC-type sugar transport system ATPase subunit
MTAAMAAEPDPIQSDRRGGPSVPAMAVHGATKRFGGVLALDAVDLSVERGEVVAILGDNGAGKSTLIKAMSGAFRLDEGIIEMDGQPIVMHSPADARALGIETVYQDLALFDNLGAVANFYAGREVAGPRWMPRGFRLLRRSVMAAETQRLLERLQVNLPDLDTPVGLMSGGQRQAVAVARAAAFASKVVILDEPTAALGLRESRRVLDLITRLRTEGLAVLVISHALDHVIEVADRAIVMRRGRVVGEAVPSTENRQRIVSLIVGGEG